jgi:hypothetical protein
MEESLISVIDKYYKLKKAYEKQFTDLTLKLIKNKESSNSDKRRIFKEFIPKCVNCKKTGGTLFTNSQRVLKAVCGSSEPCKLDIIINQGKYDNVISLDANYSKIVDTIKTKIIMTKLDFLFGYISNESDAFDNFNKQRKTLGQYTEAQLLVQKRFNEIAHNAKKDTAISLAEEKLYEEINDLKNTYSRYLEEPKASYISDMVEKYINIIQPLSDKIREMKYVEIFIEKDDIISDRKDDIFYLVEREYTLKDLEQEVYGDVKSGVVRNVE